MIKLSDKQKAYNLERKASKYEQMINVLQRATCTTTAATREKLVAADILKEQFPVHVICEALLMPRRLIHSRPMHPAKPKAASYLFH